MKRSDLPTRSEDVVIVISLCITVVSSILITTLVANEIANKRYDIENMSLCTKSHTYKECKNDKI